MKDGGKGTIKPASIVSNSTMFSITLNLKNLITSIQEGQFICKENSYILALGHTRSFLFLKQDFCFCSTWYCSVSVMVKGEITLLLLFISYGTDSIWETPDIFMCWKFVAPGTVFTWSCHRGECCHQPPSKVLTCCLKWSLA